MPVVRTFPRPSIHVICAMRVPTWVCARWMMNISKNMGIEKRTREEQSERKKIKCGKYCKSGETFLYVLRAAALKLRSLRSTHTIRRPYGWMCTDRACSLLVRVVVIIILMDEIYEIGIAADLFYANGERHRWLSICRTRMLWKTSFLWISHARQRSSSRRWRWRRRNIEMIFFCFAFLKNINAEIEWAVFFRFFSLFTTAKQSPNE